jgi:hypothetical protein
MAIYSLSHSKIGRSTHRDGTAAAHVRYITRKTACSAFIFARLPTTTPAGVGRWLSEQEVKDRKNARVVDKIMLALPCELAPEQQEACLRDFCERVTQGRVPWCAAIHRQGKDAHNPHAHIIVRDRDPATKKRVAELSEKGTTEDLRRLWQDVANAHLAQAGSEARIDRRSLKDQGADRLPQIHVGPKAEAMAAKGLRPESAPHMEESIHGPRQVDYPALDEGRTRAEVNALVIEHNRIRGEWKVRKARAISIAREAGAAAHAQLATIPSRVPAEQMEAAREGRRYSPGRLAAGIALYQALLRLLHRMVGWIIGQRRPAPEPEPLRPAAPVPPPPPRPRPPPMRPRKRPRKPEGQGWHGGG